MFYLSYQVHFGQCWRVCRFVWCPNVAILCRVPRSVRHLWTILLHHLQQFLLRQRVQRTNLSLVVVCRVVLYSGLCLYYL